MATRHIEPMTEDEIVRLATIMGPSSASAKALADAAARRARGESVAFYRGTERGHSYIFVGPPLPSQIGSKTP